MLICQLLNIQPQIQYTTSFEADVENDFRWISPKQDIADPSFLLKPYYQVFQDKHGFLPNLSIIDLLFNTGNEGILILRDSFVSE